LKEINDEIRRNNTKYNMKQIQLKSTEIFRDNRLVIISSLVGLAKDQNTILSFVLAILYSPKFLIEWWKMKGVLLLHIFSNVLVLTFVNLSHFHREHLTNMPK